jgi:hypothetical protein
MVKRTGSGAGAHLFGSDGQEKSGNGHENEQESSRYPEQADIGIHFQSKELVCRVSGVGSTTKRASGKGTQDGHPADRRSSLPL